MHFAVLFTFLVLRERHLNRTIKIDLGVHFVAKHFKAELFRMKFCKNCIICTYVLTLQSCNKAFAHSWKGEANLSTSVISYVLCPALSLAQSPDVTLVQLQRKRTNFVLMSSIASWIYQSDLRKTSAASFKSCKALMSKREELNL